ncbi:MAG: M36 family metallopeptidase [Polyangiales bacterium]
MLLLSHGCQTDAQPAPAPSPGSTAGAPAQAPQLQATAQLAKLPLAHVISRDARGNARFAVGRASHVAMPSTMDAEQAARLSLERNARSLGVTERVAHDVQLRSVHRMPAGASIYQFNQRAGGVEVFGGRASVVLDASKHMVSLTNRLSPSPDASAQARSFKFNQPEQAIARAYALRTNTSVSAAAVRPLRDHGEWREFAIDTATAQTRVIEAASKQVLFPEGDRLVPAHHVELLLRDGGRNARNQAYGYVIASDGRVLYSANLTANDAYEYRVWADPSGRPADGPLVDATPYPSETPTTLAVKAAPTTLITTEGYNHNPDGRPDPWLPAGATYTFGNNVHAYSDRNQIENDAGVAENDGFDDSEDVRADVTAPNKFDREYDVARSPDADSEQIKAAVTQIFFTNNWLHDYWYDSGFNEAAQNAQESNYGRGGEGNDPILAEAQDSAEDGASNNANMSTFSDGRSPRMQMYVWSGLPNRAFETSPAITFEDGFGSAAFGPQTFDLSADGLELVLADDGSTELPPDVPTGTGTTSDACQVPTNVQGKLAVIDRGVCPFVDKALNAQEGGAIAILLLDNAPGNSPPSPGLSDPAITLPLLALSFEDGQKIKEALAAETPVISTRFFRGPEVQHDGTIDNTVVAHEWGHYLHHRLVLCGSTSCGGMSEGWGDFVALLLVVADGDAFEGKAYPLAQYASAGLDKRASYFGIRRAPYSTDVNKNPFTFKHIRRSAELPTNAPLASTSLDNAEVHNVGEIWTQTLFDAYVNLIEEGKAQGRPFEDSRRRMTDYIVAGMKAAPIEPTFVEQRDAILSAVYAIAKSDPTRGGDFAALARGFAKRGLGVGAIAPPTESESLDEAAESFEFKGEFALDDVSLDDSVTSCDNDGILDASESGALTFTVTNTGWLPLTQGAVEVRSNDPDVEVGGGGLVEVGALEPYQSVTLSIPVSADGGKRGRGTFAVSLRASDPDAVNSNADQGFELRYNYDDVAQSSSRDDVESDQPAWTLNTPLGPDAWERAGTVNNHVWHGADNGTPSDSSLESPDLVVSTTNDLVISFRHRYSFEIGEVSAGGPVVGWDGAVIELTTDGGATWKDISEYGGDPGYVANLFTYADLPVPPGEEPEPDTNPLAGRLAYAGPSEDYPNYSDVSLNLGRQLAGQTVRIRFRIGTDTNTGDAGWDIDRIAFGTRDAPGITNKPFASLRDDQATCADVSEPAPNLPESEEPEEPAAP